MMATSFKLLVWHGPNWKQFNVQEYDFVVTMYGVLVVEWKWKTTEEYDQQPLQCVSGGKMLIPAKKTLVQVERMHLVGTLWYKVILDKAQNKKFTH